MSALSTFAQRPADASDLAAAFNQCLAETDHTQAERSLGQLVELHAEPLMKRVITARLRRNGIEHLTHVEDVLSEAVISLLLHVDDLRTGRAEPVENYNAFVSMLAARAVNDYFRRANPGFHALRNRLLYLLERYPELARWRDPASGEWICGLAEWQTKRKSPLRSIEEVNPHLWLNAQAANLHAADQLVAIFKGLGTSLKFNDLALLMARVWNVHESRTENIEDHEFVDDQTSVDKRLGHRQWLAILWKQICELNPNQRAALLLNMKGPDGNCGASLLVTTGIVTIRQIAQAIELPGEQFAALWQRLPLSDIEVGDLLGLERQQVINLRKGARARLERSLGSAGWD
jgi:DNA-directed RNA polymerase specialized sigma24 family protein